MGLDHECTSAQTTNVEKMRVKARGRTRTSRRLKGGPKEGPIRIVQGGELNGIPSTLLLLTELWVIERCTRDRTSDEHFSNSPPSAQIFLD